jgi:hypothetical protein
MPSYRPAFRGESHSVLPPNGTRTPQVHLSPALAKSARESIVTKRVTLGDPKEGLGRGPRAVGCESFSPPPLSEPSAEAESNRKPCKRGRFWRTVGRFFQETVHRNRPQNNGNTAKAPACGRFGRSKMRGEGGLHEKLISLLQLTQVTKGTPRGPRAGKWMAAGGIEWQEKRLFYPVAGLGCLAWNTNHSEGKEGCPGDKRRAVGR